ncbi:MAG: autotransporter assembly complex family protein [Pseudoxanthomonas sp.]
MRLLFPYAAVLLLAPAAASAAAIVDKVEIQGLDKDDARSASMIENINLALSLNQTLGRRIGESRLEYLLDHAKSEAAGALEPFGYYAPQIEVASSRAPQPDREDDDDATDAKSARTADHLSVTVKVALGEPVRVRNSQLQIDGQGGQDRYLQQDLAAFAPRPGEVFDHQTYEASKLKIVRRLAERGYLDADFSRRRVEVTRAEHAADIDLAWISGIRYAMGPTRFHQDYFRPGLLDKLVYWQQGSYFHQGKLDRLRQSLVALDYFSSIDIQPDPDQAVDGQVPVDVNLKLAKKSIYTYGLSYGSESGPGVLAGVERRYINSRGHKLSTLLDYAQKRKVLTTRYRVPAFAWLDGWYEATARLYDEQTDYIDTRRIELIGARSGQISEQWTVIASLHALRERWLYETEDAASQAYRYATYVYPELASTYASIDDRLIPRRGISTTLTLRGGLQGAGSDTDFAQVQAVATWYHGVGDNDRLIVRGQLGYTQVEDADALPPSLRFYAGGDNSIRGYAYREVGPRIVTTGGRYATGGNRLATASVEYEHYLHGGPWGVAAFVDSGSAWNDTPDWRTGVGMGVRYRSPIGPIRVDVAHGLNDPDSIAQLYLSIGVSL